MFLTESHILELRCRQSHNISPNQTKTSSFWAVLLLSINNAWRIVSNNSFWSVFLLIHHVAKLNMRLRNRLTILKKKRLIKTLTRWYAFVMGLCFDDVLHDELLDVNYICLPRYLFWKCFNYFFLKKRNLYVYVSQKWARSYHFRNQNVFQLFLFEKMKPISLRVAKVDTIVPF